MEISYNPNKDTINIQSHGLSLAKARYLEWDLSLNWVDERYHYDEMRFCGIVPKGSKLYFVAFTEIDDDTIRMISLREAVKHEYKKYINRP